MKLTELLNDKSVKSKAKVSTISEWLLTNEIDIHELLESSERLKAADKASCIEAVELATKQKPDIADIVVLDFMTKALQSNEPRIKWESARVIANIAMQFPDHLDKTISNLVRNANDNGTVVRWATAHALSAIIKLKTKHNKKLIPVVEGLLAKEEDNGTKKKYLAALTSLKK